MSGGWLFVLFSILLAAPVCCQKGFLSIDCGIAEDLNFTDETTKIFYTSDANFIDTGTNREVSAKYMTQTLPRPYRNLRSFPNGTRNCYTLKPVVKGERYLLRASFMYGNYDGLSQLPQFDAYVGVNRWQLRLPTTVDEYTWNDIIVVATMDYMSVCLVNTDNGTPFISALELRLLANSTYQAANESQYLQRYTRLDPGSTSGLRVRYPDDAYDRLWSPWTESFWTPINTTSPIDLRKDNGYQPALAVMDNAVRPTNSSKNLSFIFPTSNVDPRFQYHVFMHFAELEQLESNQTREFNFSLDGSYVYGPFSPKYLSVDTIFTIDPVRGRDQHEIELYKTSSSTLPPILNAVEIFVIRQLSTTPTASQDVDTITKIKAIYQIKRNWMGDPCVPANYSWDGLNCSYPNSNPPTIISLDLSSSRLTGEISLYLASLTSIQSLDLSGNKLSGPIPQFLGDLPSLSFLNLSGNQLNGTIPSNLLERSTKGPLKLSVEGNPNLNVSDTSNKQLNNSATNKKKFVVPIVATVASTVILLTLFIILWTFKKRKQDPIAKSSKGEGLALNKLYKRNGLMHSENRRFTYAEVVRMTNNFERTIGNGGFGTVYHGEMRDGTQVAVKMLSLKSVKLLSHPCQGINEFQNEAQLLMRVHHRNLVSFIGYSQEGDNMALIYEYMAQGNLASHLSGTNSNSEELSWRQRLRIALDVAQGLEYLHNGCKPPIIHRDMKTTNILLNEKLEAKIGDFGLSKSFLKDDEITHVSTAVKGTHGYLDPEYCISNNLTEKSDIYSFGVVLLELITGQPAILRISDSERRSIIDWVKSVVAGGDIQRVVDPRLEGNYDVNSVWKIVEIALACTPPRSIERPTASEAVAELKECLGTEIATERNMNMNMEQIDASSSISLQPLPR